MPLFDYRCQDCGEQFERLTAAGASDVAVACPHCESERTEREFGLPAKPLTTTAPRTNCTGTGPPCGAAHCGRNRMV